MGFNSRLLRLAVSLLISLFVITAAPSVAQTGATTSPLKIDSGWVNVEQGKLYYEMAGNGDTIVFIHDGILHSASLDYPFHELAKEFTVIRYDRRGFGRSPKPAVRYSNVEDMLCVFNQLKVKRACITGTSGGAKLCLDFAVEHPERVSSMVLVGPAVSGLAFTEHFYTKGGRFTDSIRTNPTAYIHYYMLDDPYEFAPENKEAKQKGFELLSANPQNVDPVKDQLVIQLTNPAVGRLNTLTMPTLILVGEFDQPDIHAHAGAIQAGIRNAQRDVLSHCGHLIPWEKPEEYTQRLRTFAKSADFRAVLYDQGPVVALDYLRKVHKQKPDYIPFTEAEMNIMGYRKLFAGEVGAAIDFFKLNVEAYPQSWNVFDSIGEAYLAQGDTTHAIESYEKSTSLNPQNSNGIETLKKIKK